MNNDLPGNSSNKSVPMEVTLHIGGHPESRTECLVQLAYVSLTYIAVWVPEVERWRFSHGKPVEEAEQDQVASWIDISELFCT